MRPPFGNKVLQRYLKIPVWIIRLAVSAVTHYAILLKHCAHRRKTEEVHVKMEEELEQLATPRGHLGFWKPKKNKEELAGTVTPRHF